MNTPHKYDPELGAITDRDREYAADLLTDLGISEDTDSYDVKIVAEWLRKSRYEAVIDDRRKRAAND